jgi:hypothetical protein
VLGSIARIEEIKVTDARNASAANLALVNAYSAEMLAVIVFGLFLALGARAWVTISITRPILREGNKMTVMWPICHGRMYFLHHLIGPVMH